MPILQEQENTLAAKNTRTKDEREKIRKHEPLSGHHLSSNNIYDDEEEDVLKTTEICATLVMEKMNQTIDLIRLVEIVAPVDTTGLVQVNELSDSEIKTFDFIYNIYESLNERCSHNKNKKM